MRVIPYRNVSDLGALSKDFMGADGGRFKDEVRFIVPSRRDREWWKERVGMTDYGLDAERFAGLWNWEDLYNDICLSLKAPPLRQIDPPDHRLILSHIVGSFLKERGREKGAELLKAWPGLARNGFIDILSDDIRELINEAVSPAQLSAIELDGKPTSRVLPVLYERYLAYLRGHKLMDSAQIPLAALELLEGGGAENWARDKEFVFAGFMSFTHGQLTLVSKLEALSKEGAVVLKPAAELKNFKDATAQLEGGTWENDPPLTRGTVVSLRSSEHGLEAEMTARCLALWQAGRGVLSERAPFPGFGAIGMSVPERSSPQMEAALRRYRIPYSPARGRSVAESLAGVVLSPLWGAWLQGLDAYETALLLAQPCLAGSELSIDDAVRAGPRGVKAWEAYLTYLSGADEVHAKRKKTTRPLKAFNAMVSFCRTVEKGVSPPELFSAFHAFLTKRGLWLDALADFSVNSPELDESLRELAESIEEVRAKYLALRELQPDIGAASHAVLKGKEAMDFLKSWCEDTRIQPAPPTGGALALYAGHPPILASYPVWIMTDVTQKNWPGIIRSSPLLDTTERDAIRSASAWLPSVHDKRVQKEAFFRRLLQTGDKLTVTTRANLDEEGRPLGAAPFTDSFIKDMKYWEHVEAPVMGLKELTPPGSAWSFPAVESASPDRSGRGVPVIKDSAEKLTLPVSGLHDLLDCPLRWWLKQSAKLKERRTALFSDAEAGVLIHKIWEAVWLRKRDGGEAADIRLLAAGEWAKVLASEGDYSKSARLVKDRRLARYLKNMEFYVARMADVQQGVSERLYAYGLRRSAIETEAELAPYEADGVTFTGRCDRLETFSCGCAVIVDYKWGKTASYEKKRETKYGTFKYGLQLSAYALMYNSAHPENRVAGAAFLGHRDGAVAGSFEAPVAECYAPLQKNEPVLEERTAEALEAMKAAAAILKSKRYEPSYSADACRYCDVKGVCRKGEIRGENFSQDDDEDDGDESE